MSSNEISISRHEIMAYFWQIHQKELFDAVYAANPQLEAEVQQEQDDGDGLFGPVISHVCNLVDKILQEKWNDLPPEEQAAFEAQRLNQKKEANAKLQRKNAETDEQKQQVENQNNFAKQQLESTQKEGSLDAPAMDDD